MIGVRKPWKIRLVLIRLFFAAVLLSISGCNKSGENSRYKVYVYKHAQEDGLICVFYSNYKWVAQQNAEMFSSDHEDKYGAPLIIRTSSY